MSSTSTSPRHRAPSRWCWFEGEVVTVAELVEENLLVLLLYRLRQYRRAHAGRARRMTVLPRSAEDQSAEDQSAEDQSAEDQSAEDQSAEDQSAEDQSAEDQSAEDQRAAC